MKYLITEKQNDRIIDLIKMVGRSYKDGSTILKTDLEVEFEPNGGFYRIKPSFYVPISQQGRNFGLYKHLLADYISKIVGVDILPSISKIHVID